MLLDSKVLKKNKKVLADVDATLDIRVAQLPHQQKDANDILIEQGEQAVREILAEHQSADFFILKQILKEQSSAEKEYMAARDYINQNVFDAMILEDLINYLKTRWDKPKTGIMEYLNLNKELPHNVLAEQKVLGILLENPTKLDLVADIIKSEFFLQ